MWNWEILVYWKPWKRCLISIHHWIKQEFGPPLISFNVVNYLRTWVCIPHPPPAPGLIDAWGIRTGPQRAKQQMHFSQQSSNSKQGWFRMWGNFHRPANFPDCQILPASIPWDRVPLLSMSPPEMQRALVSSLHPREPHSQPARARLRLPSGTGHALFWSCLPLSPKHRGCADGGSGFCFVSWVYLCSWVTLALDASFACPLPRLLLRSLATTES